jgi:peptidoglycan hydrolase-like protein with peptidoglycan-binding domain
VPVFSGSLVRRALVLLASLATLTALGSGSASAARGDGDLTGYAFDACSAPSQAQMDAWWESSPYAAVGVYIGGSNRLCAQPELDAAWVRKQRRTGWLVLPIQVGPQAACSGYPDRMSSDVTVAEQQGRAEAGKAVGNANALGIKKGSTLYYDLEDFDTGPDDCRRPALAFLSGWTKGLHAKGYRSGVYSSIRAAIEKLDYAHQVSTGSYAMPDVIWFAWENGRADTADGGYVDTDLWDDHARIHQYDLDARATFGGVTLDIDRNWVDVGRGSVGSPSKAMCTQRGKRVSVDLKAYPKRTKGSRGPAVEAGQCLLRRHGWTNAPITGTYDARTVAAVKKAQRRLDLKVTGKLDRTTWVALLARGSDPLVKVGSTGDAVRRLQRALTAALGRKVVVDGAFSKKTARSVAKYQRKAGLPATGVAGTDVWERLAGGR